jgi:hypothetical protein
MLFVISPSMSIGILDGLRLLSLLLLGQEDCFLDLPFLFLSLFLERIVVLLDFLLLLCGVIQLYYFLHSH